ncbi:MAG: adenylyl-sulfate kinase [Zetaproteobacteria bacterium CG2_30_46_52]|nr:MAG: adenylyl-sulfate kinase [Zetaproteobacteria bacterium CG2_30_46_52]
MSLEQKSSNVVWHHGQVSRENRESMNGHKGAVLWFTGLSGSGKSTLSHAVEAKLHELGAHTYVLDGDNVRHGLCGDLGFSDVARRENIRRIGEVSKLFVEAGVVVLTAFISPFREDRAVVRGLHQEHDFIEVHCAASLAACENRDVKGLYKRARQGEIKDFTGISSPYESPEDPEVYVNTGELSLDDSVEVVLSYLKKAGVIS